MGSVESKPLEVLMLAPYFPPRQRVGALRPARFVRWLPQAGVRPWVACLSSGDDSPHGGGTGEGALFHIRAPWDRTRSGASQSDLGGARPARKRTVFDAFADAVDRWTPIDTWWPLLASRAPALTRWARQRSVQAVWSTANPWSSHVVGASVAAQLGVPWIADYRDPWTLDAAWRAHRPAPVRAFDERTERALLGQAAAVVFTSWATEAAYLKAFPEIAGRTFVLPNSFEPADEAGSAIVPDTRVESSAQTLEFLFFGRFRATSPPDLWIEALALLSTRAPEKTAALRIVSVGGLPDADRQRAESLGVGACFESCDAVPYDQALRRLRQADALILALGDVRTDVIPAKLWDYLPAGRPIVAPVHNPDVHRILAQTGTGEALAPTAEALAAWLDRAVVVDAAGARLQVATQPNLAEIARWGADASAAALAEVFRSAVARASAQAQKATR